MGKRDGKAGREEGRREGRDKIKKGRIEGSYLQLRGEAMRVEGGGGEIERKQIKEGDEEKRWRGREGRKGEGKEKIREWKKID